MEPADQGPSAVPKMPRAAMTARSRFRFEKFGDEIGDGHGAPAEKIENASLAEAADAATGLEKIPEILGRGLIDGGRCDGDDLRRRRRAD